MKRIEEGQPLKIDSVFSSGYSVGGGLSFKEKQGLKKRPMMSITDDNTYLFYKTLKGKLYIYRSGKYTSKELE